MVIDDRRCYVRLYVSMRSGGLWNCDGIQDRIVSGAICRVSRQRGDNGGIGRFDVLVCGYAVVGRWRVGGPTNGDAARPLNVTCRVIS